MKVTLDLPDEIAAALNERGDPETVIAAGLRQTRRPNPNFDSVAEMDELMAKLAAQPTPEEVLELEASDQLKGRLEELLAKAKANILTPDEEHEWDRYELMEHLFRIATLSATAKLEATAA